MPITHRSPPKDLIWYTDKEVNMLSSNIKIYYKKTS